MCRATYYLYGEIERNKIIFLHDCSKGQKTIILDVTCTYRTYLKVTKRQCPPLDLLNLIFFYS